MSSGSGPSRRLAIASDLHLEFHKTKFHQNIIDDLFSSEFDIVILAGDIVTFRTMDKLELLFEMIRRRFQGPILFVPGNHEYYHSTCSLHEVNERLKAICTRFQVAFLVSGKRITIMGIDFVGTTLWSQLDLGVCDQINCVHKIFEFAKDHTQFIKEFEKEVVTLEHSLSECSYPTIVISHYLPSYQLIHEYYKDSSINSAFASNLDYLFTKYDHIKYWICGHTHKRMQKTIHTTQVCVWSLGYPQEHNEGSIWLKVDF